MLVPLKISVNLRIEGIIVGLYHCKCLNAGMHVYSCRNVITNSLGKFNQFVCQLRIDIRHFDKPYCSCTVTNFLIAGEVDCGGFEGDCKEREDLHLRYQESRPD